MNAVANTPSEPHYDPSAPLTPLPGHSSRVRLEHVPARDPPLLAGPGAISLAIIYSEKITGVVNTGFLVLSCIIVAALMWGALRLSTRISKVLGHTGINIATRIMGLILAAISIEFIVSGYKVLFR